MAMNRLQASEELKLAEAPLRRLFAALDYLKALAEDGRHFLRAEDADAIKAISELLGGDDLPAAVRKLYPGEAQELAAAASGVCLSEAEVVGLAPPSEDGCDVRPYSQGARYWCETHQHGWPAFVGEREPADCPAAQIANLRRFVYARTTAAEQYTQELRVDRDRLTVARAALRRIAVELGVPVSDPDLADAAAIGQLADAVLHRARELKDELRAQLDRAPSGPSMADLMSSIDAIRTELDRQAPGGWRTSFELAIAALRPLVEELVEPPPRTARDVEDLVARARERIDELKREAKLATSSYKATAEHRDSLVADVQKLRARFDRQEAELAELRGAVDAIAAMEATPSRPLDPHAAIARAKAAVSAVSEIALRYDLERGRG